MSKSFEPLDPIVIYSARLVLPITAPAIPHGAVAVHHDRVLHVGTREWVMKAIDDGRYSKLPRVEHHWNGIITPGLVNAHTHLQYTGMANVGKKTYSSFQAWSDAFDAI